jgi:hypothetical protein
MKKIFVVLMMIVAVYGCKEKYIAAVVSTGTGLLVVEGFIATGTNAITTIRLTRTTKLTDSANLYEKKAAVSIQTQGLTTAYPLTEGTNGVYTSAPLTLPATGKYRIRILTSANKEYLSDYVSVKLTPAIDSISWKRNGGGDMVVTTNSKGTQSTPYYYQWRADQTWEIVSDYSTALKFRFNRDGAAVGVEYWDAITHKLDSTIKRCWQNVNSTSILIGSTEGLTTNDLHETMAVLPSDGIQLGVLYSINVKQYSISKENYRFLEKIKKNTEQLGSIFDAQPSDIGGNVHATSNPTEIVIGYVDATQEQVKRIFISRAQVPDWKYRRICPPVVVLPTNYPDTFAYYQSDYYPVNLAFGVPEATVAGRACVVCTDFGSNIKPSFWP